MNNSEVGFSYLNELNDVQRKAVETVDGPVMVIAGPGSGKTRVLTYRIAHLINVGVAPWQILALTFTNKAAREMKERIEKVVGPKAQKVWAGTFHSLFARILRREAHHLGYPNDFTIYDTDDSKSVIKEVLKQMSLDTKVYSPGAVRAKISSAKSNLITPKSYATNEELMSYDRMNRVLELWTSMTCSYRCLGCSIRIPKRLRRNISTSFNIYWSMSFRIPTSCNMRS